MARRPQGAALTPDAVRAAVIHELASLARIEVQAADISTSAHLFEDLDIDSMGTINLLMTLETKLGLDFDLVDLVTPPQRVGDLIHIALQGCGFEDA